MILIQIQKQFQKKFTIGSNYNQQPTRKPDSSDLNKKSDENNLKFRTKEIYYGEIVPDKTFLLA